MSDALRIARWTRPANGESLPAPGGGKLAIVNNCLVIHNGISPSLPVFPYDKGVWDDTKQTFTYKGKVIRTGETIEVMGGTISDMDSFLKATGRKYDLPDCGITSWFLTF
jgi:hypothetical protein